ncbi:MAG: T9SS type A sorting domain-containing protein [Flavobacteriales bacterium]|nr:T9SS type A sorting domain-containing protein [Flavobacteriales bacterium]
MKNWIVKIVSTIIVAANIILVGYAQQAWTTQISPDNSSEMATKLIKTQDGGFLTVLYGVDVVVNTPQNITYNKIAIVKLDNGGDTVFYKKINIKDSTRVHINDFIEIPTGELLLNGSVTTVTSNDTTKGTLLVKTTNMGDTLWTKINYNHLGTGSSGYNIIGFTNKFWRVEGIANNNMFIYEYDYGGNLLNINYTDTFLSSGPNIHKDINDSVIVRGVWKGEGFLYKKMDVLFNKFYGAYYPYYSPAAYQTLSVSSSGDIALHSHTQGNTSLYIINNQFDSIVLQPYSEYEITWGSGTDQWGTNICPTSDGGYAMIGDTWNALVNNIYLIKTDAWGNKQFAEMYWSVTTHNIDVVEANDGGFVMLNSGTGYWNGNGAGIWIVKTDANGIIGLDENQFLKNEVLLYPNPAKDKVTIKLTQSSDIEVIVYSIAGEQVLSKKVLNGSNFQINLEQLPKGMYLVQLKMKDTFITKKLIKY